MMNATARPPPLVGLQTNVDDNAGSADRTGPPSGSTRTTKPPTTRSDLIPRRTEELEPTGALRVVGDGDAAADAFSAPVIDFGIGLGIDGDDGVRVTRVTVSQAVERSEHLRKSDMALRRSALELNVTAVDIVEPAGATAHNSTRTSFLIKVVLATAFIIALIIGALIGILVWQKVLK